jgi:hypothetical protein
MSSNGKHVKRVMKWLVVIGLLLTVAFFFVIPNLVRPRTRYSGPPCILQLRNIAGAKDQCAVESYLSIGAVVTEGQIGPYFRDGRVPKCPQGGEYSLNPIGVDPTCSYPGHQLQNRK